MKLLLPILWLGLSVQSLAQTTVLNRAEQGGSGSAETGFKTVKEDLIAVNSAALKSNPTTVFADDSLWSKRGFITTSIYHQGGKLSNATLREMFQASPKALANYRWGQILKPIGPLVSVAGIIVAYDGIKGHKDVATVRDRRTPTNPRPGTIEVEYTVRSLPKILGGLGLFVGGICLLELSNELTAKSAKLFIVRYSSSNTISSPKTLKLGLTTSGNLGLEAQF